MRSNEKTLVQLQYQQIPYYLEGGLNGPTSVHDNYGEPFTLAAIGTAIAAAAPQILTTVGVAGVGARARRKQAEREAQLQAQLNQQQMQLDAQLKADDLQKQAQLRANMPLYITLGLGALAITYFAIRK